jgi:hypothetical protein
MGWTLPCFIRLDIRPQNRSESVLLSFSLYPGRSSIRHRFGLAALLVLVVAALGPLPAAGRAADPEPRQVEPEGSAEGIVVSHGADAIPLMGHRAPDPTEIDLATDIRVTDVTYLLDDALPAGLYFGASWIDLDGDGNLDVTIPIDAGPEAFLRVWRRTANGFEEMTGELGLQGIPQVRAASWVDIDNDGDLDLYLSRRQNIAENLLFENRGGRLYRVEVDSGLEVKTGGTPASWSDFDGDRDLDVLLLGTILQPIRLMRNDGGFHFTDVTSQWGLDPEFPALAGAWADYDQDGDPDLALGAGFDFRLYQNDGAGRFHDVTGRIFSPRAFLVVPSWADVDSDGDLDLLVGGFNPPGLYENRLEHSDGEHVEFLDRTNSWGSGFPFGSGGTWADLDLDGDLDLLDEGGNISTQIYENRINEGVLGLGLLWTMFESGLPWLGGISWHPANADFDGDGRIDFFSPHQHYPRLYRNVTPPAGRVLRLRLQPSYGGVAVGTQVRLEQSGLIQFREVGWPQAAFSFGSADVVLSLGKRGAAPWVDVHWASGLEERFQGLAAEKLHVLVEGSGKRIEKKPGRGHRLASGSPSLSTDDEGSRIVGAGIEPSCNPCRGPVSLAFGPAVTGATGLEIFDARGRLVRRLSAPAGAARWDLRDEAGSAVPVGIYWARPTGLSSPGNGIRLVVIR